MTLTRGSGPLAGRVESEVNYRIEGPAHRLLLHPFPRRVRALLGGRTVLDTTRGSLLHETALLPRFYAPLEDFDASVLERTDHTTHCPFKGDATYWTARVGEAVAENAVWAYEQPLPEASWLAGLACMYFEKADAWLEEDEPVVGHMRDPYSRIDVRRTSRLVRVSVRGEVVAESTRARLLFETGLPVRAYLPRADVRASLLESSRRTVCAYKGQATYLSLDGLPDVAWTYEDPLPDAPDIGGLVAFHDEHEAIELTIG